MPDAKNITGGGQVGFWGLDRAGGTGAVEQSSRPREMGVRVEGELGVGWAVGVGFLAVGLSIAVGFGTSSG